MPRVNAHEQNDMHSDRPSGTAMLVAAEQVILARTGQENILIWAP